MTSHTAERPQNEECRENIENKEERAVKEERVVEGVAEEKNKRINGGDEVKREEEKRWVKGGGANSIKKRVAMVLVVMGLLFASVSFFVPWGAIDGRIEINAMGLGAEILINADMYTYKAHYTIESTGGVLGNKTTEDTVLYTEGLGGFGAVGTVLYQSPNPVIYTVHPLFPGEGDATLTVSLYRETPIWWPVGVETLYRVNVSLSEASDVEFIQIQELRFYVYTEYNETKAESSTMERNVPYDMQKTESVMVDWNLTEVGDTFLYIFRHTENKYNGRYGVGVEVVYTAVSSDGGVTSMGQKSYPGALPTPNNQIQITKGETIRIGGMALAPIFLLLGIITGLLGAFLLHRIHPHARKILVSSGVFVLLSPLFFWWGATGAVSLISMLENWFHITSFIFLPVVGGILLLVGGVVEWEEEMEEQVIFQVED